MKLSIPKYHQLRIAKQTLKMSDASARIMGGMTKNEARQIVARAHAAWPDVEKAQRKNSRDSIGSGR